MVVDELGCADAMMLKDKVEVEMTEDGGSRKSPNRGIRARARARVRNPMRIVDEHVVAHEF